MWDMTILVCSQVMSSLVDDGEDDDGPYGHEPWGLVLFAISFFDYDEDDMSTMVLIIIIIIILVSVIMPDDDGDYAIIV